MKIISGSRININSADIDSDAFCLEDFDDQDSRTIKVRLIEGNDGIGEETTCDLSASAIKVVEKYKQTPDWNQGD